MKQSLVLRLRCPRSQSTFTPESSAAAGAAFLARLARRIFSERINALRLLPTPPNPVDAFRECAIPEGWAVVQTLLEASVACGVVMSCPRAMLRTRAGLGRVDAALKHATRRCPFLGANPGVLPPIEPKAAAPSVHPDALKLVASKCPVMAPVVHSPAFKLGTITQAVVQTAHNEVMTSFAVKGHQTCPGLNTPPVCPVTNTLQVRGLLCAAARLPARPRHCTPLACCTSSDVLGVGVLLAWTNPRGCRAPRVASAPTHTQVTVRPPLPLVVPTEHAVAADTYALA